MNPIVIGGAIPAKSRRQLIAEIGPAMWAHLRDQDYRLAWWSGWGKRGFAMSPPCVVDKKGRLYDVHRDGTVELNDRSDVGRRRIAKAIKRDSFMRAKRFGKWCRSSVWR